MSQPMSLPNSQPVSQLANSVSRRKLFAGASTLGVVAATASLLPSVGSDIASRPPARTAPAKGGGYTLSEHVKRYYKTTLV